MAQAGEALEIPPSDLTDKHRDRRRGSGPSPGCHRTAAPGQQAAQGGFGIPKLALTGTQERFVEWKPAGKL